jgi:hypothetical protein
MVMEKVTSFNREARPVTRDKRITEHAIIYQSPACTSTCDPLNTGEMIWLKPDFHAVAGTDVSMSIQTSKEKIPQYHNNTKNYTTIDGEI